jgi:hypothetical protein
VALFESAVLQADVGLEVMKYDSSFKAGAKSDLLIASFELPYDSLLHCHTRDQNKGRRIIEKGRVPKQAERD